MSECIVDGKQWRVLVVDDDELVRITLQTILRRAGHDVVVAADGKAALAVQQEKPCDVIFADIFMPGMDGIEIIRELRRTGSGATIVAMSGGETAFVGMAMRLGADHALMKPLSYQDVLGALPITTN